MLEDKKKETGETPEGLVDPGDLVRDDFTPFIGQSFTIPVDGQDPLVLKLSCVDTTIHPGERKGGGFILRFQGPTQRYFRQGTFPLRFPDGKTAGLFLVNHGPMDDRMQYEAVIS